MSGKKEGSKGPFSPTSCQTSLISVLLFVGAIAQRLLPALGSRDFEKREIKPGAATCKTHAPTFTRELMPFFFYYHSWQANNPIKKSPDFHIQGGQTQPEIMTYEVVEME